MVGNVISQHCIRKFNTFVNNNNVNDLIYINYVNGNVIDNVNNSDNDKFDIKFENMFDNQTFKVYKLYKNIKIVKILNKMKKNIKLVNTEMVMKKDNIYEISK